MDDDILDAVLRTAWGLYGALESWWEVAMDCEIDISSVLPLLQAPSQLH